MNKVKLILGDWSNDGHGKCKEVILETNKEVFEIQDAYRNSCKLTGLQFNHNANYTGLPEHDKYDTDRHICTDYADALVSDTTYDILKRFITNIDSYFDTDYEHRYLGIDEFVELWIAFVSLSLSDLELKVVKEDIPVINGYWGKLNVQFGYGLF